MPAPYSNSELLWRLFRRRFCRGSSGAQDSSWTKRLVSRLSHSEKHPAEPEVEGDAGISLPWGFWVSTFACSHHLVHMLIVNLNRFPSAPCTCAL